MLGEKITKYSSNSLSDAKQALVPYFKNMGIQENDEALSPDNITFGIGSQNLYMAALKSTVGKDDVVLAMAPTYGLFTSHPHLLGGEMEVVNTQEKNNYRPTAEDIDSRIVEINTRLKDEDSKNEGIKSPEDLGTIPRVKVFLMINPDNPTGAVYTQAEVESFAAVLKKHDVKVIDDQVYRGTEYDQEKPPYPFAAVIGMGKNTLTIIGLSKAFCLPALRSAVACGPSEWISNIASSISSDVGFASNAKRCSSSTSIFNGR